MRVGMVCPYSLSVPGGVQSQVLGIARALRQRDVEVRVLGPCDGPPPDTGVTPLGNSLPTAANGSIAPIAPEPAAQLRTIRVLREERFDILHLHEPMVPGPTMTAMFVKGCPIVGTFHAAGSSAGYRWLGPALKKLSSRLNTRCAVSPDAEQMAKRWLGGEYTVLFNGIDTRSHRSVSPWPTEAPTVFFIGRHEDRKGLEVLLEASRHLPDDWHFWIGGEGSETARLLESYKHDHRLRWLGRIPAHEKAARLRGAHVFCAPSLGGESFGVVLLEAMLAGTPIVASDLESYSRVAQHGKEAVLVPRGDSDALAEALMQVLGDQGLSQSLVANGSLRVDEYSMDRLAEEYENIYRRMLGAGRKS